MTILNISNVTPGMTLSDNLFSENGLMLLPKGAIITNHILLYLNRWNISFLNITDEKKEVVLERNTKQLELQKNYQNSTNKIVEFMDALRGCNQLKLDEVRVVVDEILNYNDIHITLQIIDQMKDEDKYTYQHCLNVGIYARFLGRWLNLDNNAIKRLVYSALLHDIGKEKISKDILLKPGLLSKEEYDVIKKHPIYGYDLIKQCTHFSQDIALGIIQHHEKEDGSGYPFGIDGSKIHQFAKIIAVADIFDAMTSQRVYRDKQSPFTTANALLSNSFGLLDPKIVSVFVRRLADFYIGATVVLSNGEVGQIVMRNPIDPLKPLVKGYERFIDLGKERNILVKDILH